MVDVYLQDKGVIIATEFSEVLINMSDIPLIIEKLRKINGTNM